MISGFYWNCVFKLFSQVPLYFYIHFLYRKECNIRVIVQKMARENVSNTQGATQSQASVLWTEIESQPIQNIVWGRLYGKHIKIKTLGRRFKALYHISDSSIYFDLCQENFTTGRGEDNDLVLTLKELPDEKMLCRMSKVHFKIKRENCNPSNPVYIQDLSRNGTFVNGELIGINKTRILQNDDEIALSHPKYRVFVFKDSNLSEGQDLAKEIRSNYYISTKLGYGACGIVRLVYDRRTCVSYAMKHVMKNMLTESAKISSLKEPERVMNEAKIMKALEHPCVIKMHDIVEKPDSVYMVLEFMKGGDLLKRIITNRRLSERISKLFFYQMCHAVKYLHGKGITHRDLKPENVLLNSDDDETLLKVSDFGLSKSVQNNSVMRTVCGTPQYVAPEILITQGQGAYTKKVDIWSLGVVLFTCLSGTLPFHDDYGSPTCDQIKRGRFKFTHPAWKHVSQRAKSLITDMLTVDPDSRPAIDYVLGHSWLRDQTVITKAKALMNVQQMPQASDEENFVEPPQKRSKH